MPLTLLPQHLNSYLLWLQNHQYQSNTIRNYFQDLKNFLSFSRNQISEELIAEYISLLSQKNNSPRYLASLSLFCQFLSDQQLTAGNLYQKVKKHLRRRPSVDLKNLLIQYQNYLLKSHKSELTVKNYLNDLRQYVDWLHQHET